MNERIKDIALQAGLQPFEDCGPGYVAKMEKFAELIVKECMSICKNIEYYDDKGLSPEHCGHIRAGAVFCREDIKEHFGIEK